MKKGKKINEISSQNNQKGTVSTLNPDLWMNIISKQLSLQFDPNIDKTRNLDHNVKFS